MPVDTFKIQKMAPKTIFKQGAYLKKHINSNHIQNASLKQKVVSNS